MPRAQTSARAGQLLISVKPDHTSSRSASSWRTASAGESGGRDSASPCGDAAARSATSTVSCASSSSVHTRRRAPPPVSSTRPRGVGGHRRAGPPLAAPVSELDAPHTVLAVQRPPGPDGARFGVRTVVGAQFELVGEVGVHGQRDPHPGRHRAVAHDPQGFHERAVGHGLFAQEGVRGRLLAAPARHEHAARRVAGGRGRPDRREELGHGSVDGQLPAAQVPRIPYEQTVGTRATAARAAHPADVAARADGHEGPSPDQQPMPVHSCPHPFSADSSANSSCGRRLAAPRPLRRARPAPRTAGPA